MFWVVKLCNSKEIVIIVVIEPEPRTSWITRFTFIFLSSSLILPRLVEEILIVLFTYIRQAFPNIEFIFVIVIWYLLHNIWTLSPRFYFPFVFIHIFHATYWTCFIEICFINFLILWWIQTRAAGGLKFLERGRIFTWMLTLILVGFDSATFGTILVNI